jgi:pimeloyl-ACP methyl ester carboxylesterase
MSEVKVCETEKGIVEYTLAGEGPVVLIVHGGHGSCRYDFKQQMLIDNGFSVLMPTRPGYGGTPIESGKTAEATADLFAALLKALGIDRVSVIGNSAGGPVSLEFAKRYPQLTEKLILEAAVVKPWFHRFTPQYYGVKVLFHPGRQKRFWKNLRGKLRDNETKTLVNNIRRFTKLRPKDVLGNMSREDIQCLKKYMVTGNDSGNGFVYDVEHRARDIDRISCPTMIIHSKNDGCIPFSHAEYANRQIRNSEMYAAPTESHFVYVGPGSDEVLAKRMEFLSRKI